jgi:hypothetical protein
MAKRKTKKVRSAQKLFLHLVKAKCKDDGATKRRRKRILKDAAKMARTEWL